MSYFIDDDASQIRELKDKLEKLQSDFLSAQFSVQQENVESGQSTFPIANPSARGGGTSGGGGGSGLTEPLFHTITTLTPQTLPTKTDINSALTNVFKITLDRDIEFDIINPNATKFEMLHIVITQDAVTARTILWPGSVNGTPSIDASLRSETTVSLFNMGDGTWRFVSTKGGVVGTGDNWSAFPAIQTTDMANFSFSNYVGWTAAVGQSMDVGATGNTWNLPSADVHLFRVNGADQFEVKENSMDVHNHSFTNFVGWTGLVGQGLTLDATGAIYDLPTGDQHAFRVNGTQEFVVAGGALGANSPLSMNSNKITSVTDPTNPQDVATKAYVDSGGVTEFTDSTFRIKDNIDDTRKLAIETGGIITATTRTWTAQNASGTVALLDSGSVQNFSDSIRPSTNGTLDWGDSTHHLNQLFSEQITLRSTSGPALSTTAYLTADSSNMIGNVPTGDEYVWKIGGTTHMQWTRDTNGRLFIRSGAAKEMGFVTSTSNIVVGTSGSIEIPVDGGSVGSAAAANTDFGDSVGCIGMYLNTIGSGNPTICFKIDDGTGTDNRWAAIIINRTTGALSGSILT